MRITNDVPRARPQLTLTRAGLVLALALLGVLPSSAGAVGPGGWDHLGSGLNDRVLTLNSDLPGTLLVGGTFTDAGGNAAADYVATWDGASWGSLGSSGSLNGAVNAIAVSGTTVIVGGTFTNAGGSGANFLARWTGAAWQPLCAPLGAQVRALEIVGTTLYIGGDFLNVNGDPAGDQLVKCDLGSNVTSNVVDADPDIDGAVQALVADASGNVYAGGTFFNLDGIPQADYVAKYNGSSWSAMGSGLDPSQGAIDTANVDALATDGTNVYVGADDTDIAGLPAADHVARWDGAGWSAVGSGPGGDGYFPASATINGLHAVGSRLFAAGAWTNAAGDPLADNVAAFDGAAWSAVGSNGAGNGPWIGPGNAISVFAGTPVAGGQFVDAGGDPQADRIASFPGTTITDPPPQPQPQPQPEPLGIAKLGKTPKKKVFTDDKRAKVRFTFAAENASGYVCRLDRKEFAPCTSPKRVKAKLGKHTFQVAGVDAAGSAGAPDSFKFKVLRKEQG